MRQDRTGLNPKGTSPMGNNTTIISDKSQLVDWLAAGAKPAQAWRIGTEHEKFLFHRDGLSPVAYEGPGGVAEVLTTLCAEIGDKASPIIEAGHIIGLKDGAGGSVTLEPGGQLELSGAPLENLHQTCAETGRHLRHMRAVSDALGLGMLGIGFQPKWTRDEIFWMPKGKFRTSLALQPVATALFANSPFKDGTPSGLLSTRAYVWTDTDNARCGVPACVFDPQFGYEQWIDYILDVPMYFLHRGDDYIDVAGRSFHDYLAGTLPGFQGAAPVMADFEDHITTAFPEVRLKQYLEMRGADGGSWANICALPAYWVGLLYDETALAEAEALVADITADDVMAARLSVAHDGLRGHMAGRPIHALAARSVDIAFDGLRRRHVLDGAGNDETGFLQPLRQIIASQKTPAEVMLDLYNGEWGQNIDQVFVSNQY
jgi:glutamate--cysteine ligase